MTEVIEVAGRQIGTGRKVFIVAEAGVNHNGNVDPARSLIDAAAAAGADAVKFQSFDAAGLVRRGTALAPYQHAGAPLETDQQEMLASLQLDAGQMASLKRHCEEAGLVFICTPFDPKSALELVELGVEAIKVGSADLTDALLLETVAEARVPLILSTGMSDLALIGAALDLLEKKGARDVVLLHCVSAYPAPPGDLNLSFMRVLADEFSRPVGFSDHTEGTMAAPLAVAAGACLIEKHITLDRNMKGPDHAASVEPAGMRALVDAVRSAELMLGSPRKDVSGEELRNAEVARKSLVFASSLPAGARIERSHLAAKRPADGISPMEYARFIGRVLAKPVDRDDLLSDDLFE